MKSSKRSRKAAAAERERAHASAAEAIKRFERTAELAQAKAVEHAVAAERERWRHVLTEHYLINVACDHALARDQPWCACSLVDLGWHPSVGAAVDAWISHVADLLEGNP